MQEDRLRVVSPGSEIYAAIDGSPARCGQSIYDESGAAPNPQLTEIIGKFAQKNVLVKVELRKGIANDGYVAANDSERSQTVGKYTEDLVEVACKWDTSNLIVVTRSWGENGFKFNNIATYGAQDRLDRSAPQRFTRSREILGKELTVGGNETNQQDIAVALSDIYAFEFPVSTTPAIPIEQPARTPQIEVPSSRPAAESDNHEALIVGGGVALVGLVIAGTAVDRIGRWRTGGKVDAEFKTLGKEHMSMSNLAFSNEKMDPTSPLILAKNEDDAVRLKELSREVADKHDDWQLLVEEAQKKITGFRDRFWPSRRDLRAVLEDYKSDSAPYVALIDEFNVELAKVQKMMNEVDGEIKDADAKYENTAANVSNLGIAVEGRQAYDITLLLADLSAIDSVLKEAHEKRQADYIEAPYMNARLSSDKLGALQEFVDAMPAFHAGLTERTAAAQNTQNQNAERLIALTKTYEAMTDDFDDSCWKDVQNSFTNARNVRGAIDELVVAVGSPVETYDIAKLRKDDEDLNTIGAREEYFVNNAQKIEDRYEKLLQLQRELPGTVSDIGTKHDQIENFIDAYAEDIVDATEKDIHDLQRTIRDLQESLTERRPEYLQIEEKAANLDSDMERLKEQAETERNEMIFLRQDNEAKEQEFMREWQSLINYEAGHSDVDYATESDIASLSLPELPRERSREGLRTANRLWLEALENLRDIRSDAEDDVRREVARRAAEAAAEAARLAAIAQEQARQTAERTRQSMSIGRSSGGSSHSNHIGFE